MLQFFLEVSHTPKFFGFFFLLKKRKKFPIEIGIFKKKKGVSRLQKNYELQNYHRRSGKTVRNI